MRGCDFGSNSSDGEQHVKLLSLASSSLPAVPGQTPARCSLVSESWLRDSCLGSC